MSRSPTSSKCGELLGRAAADDPEDRVEVLLLERREAVHRVEIAVATEDRRLADLQMNVAGAELDGAPEQVVQIHEDSDMDRRSGTPALAKEV